MDFLFFGGHIRPQIRDRRVVLEYLGGETWLLDILEKEEGVGVRPLGDQYNRVGLCQRESTRSWGLFVMEEVIEEVVMKEKLVQVGEVAMPTDMAAIVLGLCSYKNDW